MNTDLKVKKHGDRSDLVGEHVWGDAGQLILFLIFLIVWIADSFVFHYSTFLSDHIPFYIRLPIALVILSGAVYFARAGLRIIFGEIREQPVVIRNGVFNLVWHPIYFGSLLFYLGLIVLTLSIISFILWLGIIVFYYVIARYEEQLLLDKFGFEYEKYQSEVPMWIPQLFSIKHGQ